MISAKMKILWMKLTKITERQVDETERRLNYLVRTHGNVTLPFGLVVFLGDQS